MKDNKDSTKIIKSLIFIITSFSTLVTIFTTIIIIISITGVLFLVVSLLNPGGEDYISALKEYESDYEEKNKVELDYNVLRSIDATLNIYKNNEEYEVLISKKQTKCLYDDDKKAITNIEDTFDCLGFDNQQKEIAKMQYEANETNTNDTDTNVDIGDGNFSDGELLTPYLTNTYVITAGFGWYSPFGQTLWHTGNDFVSSTDKIVYASSPGVVVKINLGCTVGDYNCGGGYGNYVELEHVKSDGTTYYTKYAHFSEIYVSTGDNVTINTALGHEGTTGFSTGSHLHFEVRFGGNSSSNAVDPQNYIKQRVEG